MLCSALCYALLCFAAGITSNQTPREGLGIGNNSKLPAVPAALIYRASSVRMHQLETLEMHSVSQFSSIANVYFEKMLLSE